MKHNLSQRYGNFHYYTEKDEMVCVAFVEYMLGYSPQKISIEISTNQRGKGDKAFKISGCCYMKNEEVSYFLPTDIWKAIGKPVSGDTLYIKVIDEDKRHED